jgi:RNA polymerase sigma-70 factor (ECF subfamily)
LFNQPVTSGAVGLSDFAENDELLVQATGRGNLKSFEQLVERHQNWAWRIAYRFTGNEIDASDIVQEAFLRLLHASDRYSPKAKFKTYFYQIISHLCLDRAKKKQPLFFETVPESADPRPDVADVMMRREATVAIRSALNALPPNQRLAIVLRYYEDLNYQEIASALEITTKAAERLLARGRERLRALLGNRDDFFHN